MCVTFVVLRMNLHYLDVLITVMSAPLTVCCVHVVQAVLEEQLSESQELGGAHLRLKHMSVIPDALYMVEDKEYAASLPPPAHIPSSSSTVDIIAGTIPGECDSSS